MCLYVCMNVHVRTYKCMCMREMLLWQKHDNRAKDWHSFLMAYSFLHEQ